MTEQNGHFKFERDVDQIKTDVREMKDELARAINNLAREVSELSTAMIHLDARWQSFSHNLLNSVPIKAVMWMFVILGLTVTLIIAGVEGARAIAPTIGGLIQ